MAGLAEAAYRMSVFLVNPGFGVVDSSPRSWQNRLAANPVDDSDRGDLSIMKW